MLFGGNRWLVRWGQQVDSECHNVEYPEFLRASIRPVGKDPAFEAQIFQRSFRAVAGLVFAETVRVIGELMDQSGQALLAVAGL